MKSNLTGYPEQSKHDWQRIGDWWPADRLHSFRCSKCGLKASHRYTSHRKGWQKSANMMKPCREENVRFVRLSPDRIAQLEALSTRTEASQ